MATEPKEKEAVEAGAQKRPAEGEVVEQDDVDAQGQGAKRARTEGDGAGNSGGSGVADAKLEHQSEQEDEGKPERSVTKAKVEMLPMIPLEQAVEVTATASGLKVEPKTTRLEVCWDVADDEAEDPKSITLWWGCVIAEFVEQHPTYGPVWLLKYDEKDVESRKFEAEERKVVFCSPGLLVDLEAGGEGNSGGGITLMQWKTEASSQVPQPILPLGQTVKAKFKGRDAWFAGVVADLHMDGTYHIKYADGDEEVSVTRDLIEPVELEDTSLEEDQEADDPEDAEADEDTIVAHDIDTFFELFTQIMTSGPTFVALPPEKQRFAADRIAHMRPIFREELEGLIEERGRGYVVGGDDIKRIIPVVMRRSAEASHAQPVAAGVL